MKTAIIYSDEYLKHDTGAHPENKNRLIAIMNLLREKNILSKVRLIQPRYAKEEEIELVHTRRYIEEIKNISTRGGGYLDLDTPVSRNSYNAALLAVGGLFTAIDEIMKKEVTNAFCLVRPPGHHAEINHGMGFCLFNNVAVAARYAQKEYKLNKILIIDFDVHHGNSTQNVFYNDKTVLFFSIHRYPFYPGTGTVREIGTGEATGYTINVPLPSGATDADYEYIFEEILERVATQFHPELILVSAGYDAHSTDPIGDMNLTVEGYKKMTKILKSLAANLCNDRLIYTLEGGYNLTAISYSVAACISVLADLDILIEEPNEGKYEQEISRIVKSRVAEVKGILREYWGI